MCMCVCMCSCEFLLSLLFSFSFFVYYFLLFHSPSASISLQYFLLLLITLLHVIVIFMGLYLLTPGKRKPREDSEGRGREKALIYGLCYWVSVGSLLFVFPFFPFGIAPFVIIIPRTKLSMSPSLCTCVYVCFCL